MSNGPPLGNLPDIAWMYITSPKAATTRITTTAINLVKPFAALRFAPSFFMFFILFVFPSPHPRSGKDTRQNFLQVRTKGPTYPLLAQDFNTLRRATIKPLARNRHHDFRTQLKLHTLFEGTDDLKEIIEAPSLRRQVAPAMIVDPHQHQANRCIVEGRRLPPQLAIHLPMTARTDHHTFRREIPPLIMRLVRELEIGAKRRSLRVKGVRLFRVKAFLRIRSTAALTDIARNLQPFPPLDRPEGLRRVQPTLHDQLPPHQNHDDQHTRAQ